ncbi:MAG TPA: hypothetical protein VGR78_19810 [Verrucomicrobiae bacterium]|nr:hypothetical protein [Verrucomicrobiae bacterium]
MAMVRPASTQPHESDPAVIFQDDFRQTPVVPRYFEYDASKGSFVWTVEDGLRGPGLGPEPGVMRCQFEKGQVSAGSLKVVFGRNPFNRGARRTESFREIYWRVYVQHEAGWEGNPAKLARATSMAGSDWSQGLIAHVWGGKGEVLCIDPATGIRNGQKMTTRYNDFQNLKWLGLRNGQTPIFSASESGRWVCVESHVRLNTPGKEDGVFELWVDGKMEAARTDLNWHGDWQEYAINAVFLENYWNDGSGKRQARWFDNFVVSTAPIGPITAVNPPALTRTRMAFEKGWEVEVATDPEGRDIVWRSKALDVSALDLVVDTSHGRFSGSRTGLQSLAPRVAHWVRIRFVDSDAWSPWHAPFKCEQM